MKRVLCLICLLLIVSVGGCIEDEQECEAQRKERRARSVGPLCSDFRILSCTWYLDKYGDFQIVGEIKNVGRIAAMPTIEIIIRDRYGTLVDSKSYFPYSLNNLPPGSTCGFEHLILEDKIAGIAKTAEAKIVRVKVWKD